MSSGLTLSFTAFSSTLNRSDCPLSLYTSSNWSHCWVLFLSQGIQSAVITQWLKSSENSLCVRPLLTVPKASCLLSGTAAAATQGMKVVSQIIVLCLIHGLVLNCVDNVIYSAYNHKLFSTSGAIGSSIWAGSREWGWGKCAWILIASAPPHTSVPQGIKILNQLSKKESCLKWGGGRGKGRGPHPNEVTEDLIPQRWFIILC